MNTQLSPGRLPTAWFALPLIALGMLMIVAPAFVTITLAFTDFNGFSPLQWDGFGRILDVLQAPIFRKALRNTVWFLALTIPLRAGMAWAAACLGGSRGVVLLPTLIPDAAYALAFTWIFNPMYGPVNQLLDVLGISGPGWLGEVGAAPWVFVAMAGLQMGESYLIAGVSLRSIPVEQIEAARLEGAGESALVRWVRWPALRGWFALALARDAVLLSTWTLAPTIQMTGGDPVYSTLFLPLHAFRTTVDFLRFGDGAVITLVGWLMVLPVLLGAAALLSHHEHE